MRKVSIGILFICLFSLFISCNKEKTTSDKKTVESSSKKESTKKKETITSVILYDGTPLYIENSEGKMVYAEEAPVGEVIRIYLNSNEIEQKEAIRLLSSGKEENLNFVHVSFYDNDYWTRDIFITNDSSVTPAVINSQAITYSSADGSSATSKKLDEGTIVAVNEASKTKDPDLDIEFIEVTYYNGAAFGKKVYVKNDFISSNTADILALQTISRIKAIENLNPDVKEKLTEALFDLPVSEYVAEKIDELEL